MKATFKILIMTKLIFAGILCCCATIAFSQSKDLSSATAAPDAVLRGFIKQYGDAKATWTLEEGNYAATFKLLGMPAMAWYDSTGHRVKYVIDIKEDQLPSIARSYLDRNFPKSKIIKAQKWTDDNRVSTFQAEIKSGIEMKNLLFTSRGDLIKEPGKE
jgi:hypothetical protein